MSSSDQEPIFSNEGAEIIIVDETVGVIGTTRRPASGASRKAIQKQLQKEADFRELMEQIENTRVGENEAQQKGASMSDLEQRSTPP